MKRKLAVPPFYFYRREDVKRIPEALAAGCGADAPGSFAAWLSRQVPMPTLDIEKPGDISQRLIKNSYAYRTYEFSDI